MIINKSEFITSAVRREQYPEDGLNEVAFVGRSNVGRSSIINALTNRRKLAKVSQTPGKTKLINFFLINDAFYLVDLPGYGYSKMSKKEQAIVGNFIEEYLKKSKNIALILFLIDIRHTPTSNDQLMYDYIIKCNLPCLVIANKADKIAITKVDEQVSNLQNVLNPLKDLTFLPFSSERKIYVDNAWKNIEYYIK